MDDGYKVVMKKSGTFGNPTPSMNSQHDLNQIKDVQSFTIVINSFDFEKLNRVLEHQKVVP